MRAFDAHSLAKSRELDLAMMFVQGRLVCPSHRFGQIRILASTFRAPGAKIRPFRCQSAIAGHESKGGRNIDWFRIKRNWIPTSQAVHNPVPERVFFVAHKQCSKGKSWSVRVPHHRQAGQKRIPCRSFWQALREPSPQIERVGCGKQKCPVSWEPEAPWKRSRANRIAVSTDGFHGLASAPGVHLFQDSMDVISHRELREIQMRSDFLVCQTFGDEGDQLLLAQGKIGSGGRALDGHLIDHVSNEAE